MRKFLFQVLIFAILMAVCDILVGVVGDYLVVHAKGGETARKNYIANGTNENVLIFGSSRALRHYDPNIFEDSLGMSAYNCGFTANGIICAYGYFRMIEERYHPRILIFEVTPGFDLLVGDNNTYLGELRYYYDGPGIDSIFWKVDNTQKYKMLSQMYRFNSMFPQLITDNLRPLHSFDKGYEPYDREMLFEPHVDNEETDYKIDWLKLYYLERLINDCEGNTQLIFTVSPFYMKTTDGVLEPIKALCDKYGVPLINHFTDSTFNNHREFFYDSHHLNLRGATEYSKEVAGEVKKLVK